MKLDTPDSLRYVFGSEQQIPEVRRLVAGDLQCDFVEGELKGITWKGIEVVRCVSYLLRDQNWGTAPASIVDLKVSQGALHFEITFTLLLNAGGTSVSAYASIHGEAQGSLEFSVEAIAEGEVKTNRCGFVVLHPSSVAGVPLEIEHTSGDVEVTQFPVFISPGQVAFDIRRLTHFPNPEISVDCRMMAELPHDPAGKFEMEDQRNWSDASFKTYVASLLDPWPYVLAAEKKYKQSVQIEIHDRGFKSHALNGKNESNTQVEVGEALEYRLPKIGVGVPLSLHNISAPERQAVIALNPRFLVAELDLADRVEARAQLEAVHILATESKAAVQLDAIVLGERGGDWECKLLAQLCIDVGLEPEAIRICPSAYLKSYQPNDVWPLVTPLEEYALHLRAYFPRAKIGGGMLTYFTELNRKRQSKDHIDFIGHSTCPIVHTADDGSVMQSCESLESITASVRNIWPDLDYRLGPITLAMHRNPYGSSTKDNPEGMRLAMANKDPRHRGAFGAAWLTKYVSSVLGVGVDVLSFNHTHGDSGPSMGPNEIASSEPLCVPAWRVHWLLSRYQQAPLKRVQGIPAGLAAFAWVDEQSGAHVLMANTTPDSIDLALPGSCTVFDLAGPCAPSQFDTAGKYSDVPKAIHPYQTLWVRV